MGRAARARRSLPPAVRTVAGPVMPAPALRPPAPARPVREDVRQGLARVKLERDALERQQGDLVGRARAEGVGWAEIGRHLGVTGQAVSQRYGRPAVARCHFADKRDDCEGVAVVRRGRVPLCGECSRTASSLSRQPARPARQVRA